MPTKRHFTSFLLVLLLLLSGCGGSSSRSSQQTSAPQNFTLDEKIFVHELFQTEYLWFDRVTPEIDYENYTTPQSLVDALKVTPPDRWSFAITAQEYEAYTSQQTGGFGFGYVEGYRIYTTLLGSPADGKLQRGDTILKINGEPASYEAIQAASRQFGTPARFTIDRHGTILDISVTPSTYHYRVTEPKVISYGGHTVGYLRYDAFSGSSVTELENAFSTFKNAAVDRLVVDLRYNGGGDVAVASILLDNITNAHPGSTQFYLDWNENNKDKNSYYTFEEQGMQDGNELTMQQVIFLVTADTASASEAVISALKPYLGAHSVITIGTPTHGKNVGMEGRSYGNDYYFLINFYVKNAQGGTTPFSGIPPTCSAPDDLEHLRGDPEERMFKTALHYIVSGSCL